MALAAGGVFVHGAQLTRSTKFFKIPRPKVEMGMQVELQAWFLLVWDESGSRDARCA